MSRRKAKPGVVWSLDEIPEFSSEDEERDWWATHTFSSDLYRQLQVDWTDLEALLPLGLKAREASQVQLPLVIAKRHLAYIKRGRGKPLTLSSDVRRDDPRLHHAIVSIVFSAAAVEAGLNLYLTAPVLLLADEGERRFFGLLASKYARLNVPQKLAFVQETCLALEESLTRKIRELFNRRNELVHALPRYSEAYYVVDWPEEPAAPSGTRMARERGPKYLAGPSAFAKKPVLTTFCGPSSDDLEKAFEYYDAAVELLDRLPLSLPERQD